MLQNWANYLLGSVTNQDINTTPQGVENSSIRLTSVEQEDDWVLVDRDSEGNSDASSVGSLEETDYQEVDTNIPIPALLTRTSSTSSLAFLCHMEESWFVTPPPCFTSAGPIHMETSPLENLLIEHPSMSVYQHTHPNRRHINTTVPFISSSPDSDRSEEELEVEEVPVVMAVIEGTPYLNHLQQQELLVLQQERQRYKARRAQKIQVQKACQAIKRNNLNRNNKAREVNCRNRRQRRGERSQGATRSYANNNRKC